MKPLNILKMVMLGIAVFVVPASTASATVLTSPAGTTYTSTEHSHTIDAKWNFIGVQTQCKTSTIHKTTETHGAGVTASGKVSSLTFSECNFPVKVQKAGSLEIHATSGGNGTVTSSGAEILIESSVGNCIFTTSSTDIGTLTGSSSTKSTARLDVGSNKIPRTGGNFLCGSSGEWVGTYVVNSPDYLVVD